MDRQSKRYRAFISYSQRDKALARRLHRALENYHVPKGVDAPVGRDRALGRFFRDDDEMGASQSLGAALEGALDDSENLIVICSPSAAQSKWVDAEVRRFKRRGDTRVFAVIASGEPNSHDPTRECFPPSLKVKIDAAGRLTGEPDEPRAPDLQREGMQRVRAQLAAGLLDVPFDGLWQRDRRRARRAWLLASAVGLLIVTVLGVTGFGWLAAQRDSRMQAANQAVSLARGAIADGRIGDALSALKPHLAYPETRTLVEGPLRAILGWIPDPYVALNSGRAGARLARLRDATVLLDPQRGVNDVSDAGLKLTRIIRSRDGKRVVAVGDQRVVVIEAQTGRRLAQVDNGKVQWVGHAFEAPSGLIIVTGAILGPTNGSVWPYALSISADGTTLAIRAINAHMFWGSAVGVTAKCDSLLVAAEDDDNNNNKAWRLETYELAAGRLSEPVRAAGFKVTGDTEAAAVAALRRFGPAFLTRDAFLGEAKSNPFTVAGCLALGADDGFVPSSPKMLGAPIVALEPGLTFESAGRWNSVAIPARDKPAASGYLPTCTEARPCRIVGGRTDLTFVRDSLPVTAFDRVGRPPASRWSRKADSSGAAIYFDHRVFNSGHQLVVCRQRDGRDTCLLETAMGEDQLELPFLRSPDGRYLFWPFGGAVFDLETLQPLTKIRAIPRTMGQHYDFEVDRPGLTLAFEGRLVSFFSDAGGGIWNRTDEERASPHFGVLSASSDAAALHTLASLGGRQYLAVRKDGIVTRLDAITGREMWRVSAAGLGEVREVHLNPERLHVLVMGKDAWRVFSSVDGFALSGLLAPPPALANSKESFACQLEGTLGPRGEVVGRCGRRAFLWQPRAFSGDMAPLLDRLTCAADVKASALDVIRRCYVSR